MRRTDLILTTANFANLSLLGPALAPLLRRATVVPSREAPAELVTVNSRVHLVYRTTGVSRVVTLVYPPDADASLDLVSVLDPLGMALLGARPGEVLTVAVDGRKSRLRLEGILYQPERSLRHGLRSSATLLPESHP